MFYLAAILVAWIGGDFVYRKVAAKNIFRLTVYREAEKKNQFSFVCIFLILDRKQSEFFHTHQGKYRLQFCLFNYGVR